MVQRDAKVVARGGVRRLRVERAAIALLRFGEAPVLVQSDAALVPQLRARRLSKKQIVVERQRILRVTHEQVDLGHRLEHEIALFSALERDAVLAQRLGVVALAAECESEVVAGELTLAGHLKLRASRAGRYVASASRVRSPDWRATRESAG